MLRARDNPFSTDRVLRQRYRFDEHDWDRLLQTLDARHGRGAIVGPKGSGKTTLLEDLATRLTRDGFHATLIRLNTEAPRLSRAFDAAFFTRLGCRDAVLLDGAEQLDLGRWLRFRWQARHARIIVVTTHHAGRLPTLRRCVTSPELLRELVSSLGVELNPAEAAALHRVHHGNIREALRELYDRCAMEPPVSLSLTASLV